MTDGRRSLLLAALLSTGIALVVATALNRTGPPLPSSLAPAFQLLGTPVQAVNHLVTRVIPVNDLDEGEMGEIYRARYAASTDTTDVRYRYTNVLLERVSADRQKPFPYRAYLLDYDIPNAMALPGGVVLVTTGLLDVLQSESELVSVLGHEVGHIERGHCLDAVRFGLLADKIGVGALGDIADFAVRLLAGHSFSKTQEDDADEYAWAVVEPGIYDPRGVGAAFASLMAYNRAHGQSERGRRVPDPIRDYFRSHPPLPIREAKFRERAEAWWRRHPDAVRLTGRQNLRTWTPVADPTQ